MAKLISFPGDLSIALLGGTGCLVQSVSNLAQCLLLLSLHVLRKPVQRLLRLLNIGLRLARILVKRLFGTLECLLHLLRRRVHIQKIESRCDSFGPAQPQNRSSFNSLGQIKGCWASAGPQTSHFGNT